MNTNYAILNINCIFKNCYSSRQVNICLFFSESSIVGSRISIHCIRWELGIDKSISYYNMASRSKKYQKAYVVAHRRDFFVEIKDFVDFPSAHNG